MTESSSSSANSDEHMRSSLLKTRLELYGVYETPEALRADMEKYQAESYFFHAEQPINNGMDDNDDDFLPSQTGSSGYSNAANDALSETGSASAANNNSINNNNNTAVSTRQQTSSDRDIWGRFPLKEAKELIPCPVCGRPNGTLRLATHLDKCMGIGTTVRSAAAAMGSTRSAAAASQTKGN